MLLRLRNTPRDYAWGSATLLAAFEGREPSGQPEAEVWFGDHPSDPAELADGRTLDQVTGGSLPFLLKLLAAGSPLSIQVHPTRAQAKEGWARQKHSSGHQNYQDDNHKPELIVALSDEFEALCGLRPLDATLRLVRTLAHNGGVSELTDRLAACDGDLGPVIAWLLSGDAQSAVDEIIQAVDATASDQFAGELANARRIAAQYPGDPGVVVALLMNYVVLRRGEGIFLGAGLLHAYVSGLGVEIMAASDNVLRGGLTPKHIDVAELLRILDARPAEAVVLNPTEPETHYRADVTDFALARVTITGPRTVAVKAPAIALVTAGEITIGDDSGDRDVLGAGGAVYIEGATSLSVDGHGEVFFGTSGARHAEETA